MATEFGPANTLATVSVDGPGSTIEDANADLLQTSLNDCDGASGTSTISSCENNALNEAHFSAISGGYVDVDKVEANSEMTNYCDDLNNQNCKNDAKNTFVASASKSAEINLNSAVYQTNDVENNCNDAKCNNNAINAMLLVADNGATLTASDSDLEQKNTAYNGCYDKADCSTISSNTFQITAGGLNSGGDVTISDLTQKTDLSNTCFGSGTTCSLIASNTYVVTNNDDSPITVNPFQSVSLSCSGNVDCVQSQQNSFLLTKTTGQSLTYTSTQTSTSGGASNTFAAPSGAQGSCTLTQTNGATTVTPNSPGVPPTPNNCS
jgi:hypothetical protein